MADPNAGFHLIIVCERDIMVGNEYVSQHGEPIITSLVNIWSDCEIHTILQTRLVELT
jgi:hypothetical protein